MGLIPTQRFLIDTDTASDDAVALVMALRNPEILVEAITVVAGNVPLGQAVQNALYTRDLCGSDAPVFAGREGPIERPLATAQFVHGEDGMGDIGLPLSGRTPANGDAIEVLVESIRESPGELTLVTLGPLTNVASALAMEPKIAGMVKECFAMGGTCSGGGNVTDSAEYNFWADPEAASIVVQSGMLLTVVGWDMSVRYATFGFMDAKLLRAIGPLGEFCVDIQATLDAYAKEESGLAGFDLPDPLAMAVAVDPLIARFQQHGLEVESGDGENRGKDTIDWLDAIPDAPQARITTEVDRARFLQMLYKACRDDTSRA